MENARLYWNSYDTEEYMLDRQLFIHSFGAWATNPKIVFKMIHSACAYIRQIVFRSWTI